MPDFDELEQIQMVANLLSSMPPQRPGGQRIPIPRAKLSQWASELVRDFGVRVHLDLARKELVDGAPGDQVGPGLTPKRTTDVVRLPDILKLIRETANDVPGLRKLADDIDAAVGDPQREAEMRERIGRENPDVIATARQLAARAKPSVYERRAEDTE